MRDKAMFWAGVTAGCAFSSIIIVVGIWIGWWPA